MTFSALGLAEPLLRAIDEKGYNTPSPVQAQAIPAVLDGRDVMAAAQTGTGKTAAFTLPMLQRLSAGKRAKRNAVRALVLTPTRELAGQVGDNAHHYGKHLKLSSGVIFGGVSAKPQLELLARGVDLLVATPGRLLDLQRQGAVQFDQLEMLVLDEADRMLDMGFIHDIRRILALLPPQRQNLMFSATFSGEIRKLTEGLLNDPVKVEVNPPNATAQTVQQRVYPVDKGRKAALLSHLIERHDWQQTLVFTRTKRGANQLAKKLVDTNISAEAIHGNKSQNARQRALSSFKNGKVRVLVATDIAARGLDIAQLPQVVNYELPNVPADYVHRIGRTGRAGTQGHAYSLVCADEQKLLLDIERLVRLKLPADPVSGFEPSQTAPTEAEPAAKPANRRRRSSGKPANAGKATNRPAGQQGKRNSQGASQQAASAENTTASKRRRPRRRRPAKAAAAANPS
ncbi:DEAD/DEAH box helicase [Marinobacterium arenosum]|uniref:DEAD/DEAH box helicase n=1 Tax=Marinobacterium arenosum TaxID=2862496 RepID=UPI001C945DAD|nr:DEAD/DEAH box helicase [Marinobacterium arenosum]MBY4676952.1 DEAD/DEAH box helicase [Marinobacterium arenosum]